MLIYSASHVLLAVLLCFLDLQDSGHDRASSAERSQPHARSGLSFFYISCKISIRPFGNQGIDVVLDGERAGECNVSMIMSVLRGPLGSLVVTRVPARGLSRQPNDRDGQTGPTHFRGRRSKMGYRFLDLQDRISKIEDGGGSSIFDSEGRRWGRSPSIFGAGRSENPPPSIFEAGRAKNSPIFDLRPSIFDPEDRRTPLSSIFDLDEVLGEIHSLDGGREDG